MLTGTERALQPRIRQVQRSQGGVESAAAKEAPGGGFTTEQDLTREGVRQWGGLDFLPRAGGGQCAWGVSGPALPPGTCFQEREELLLPTAVSLQASGVEGRPTRRRPGSTRSAWAEPTGRSPREVTSARGRQQTVARVSGADSRPWASELCGPLPSSGRKFSPQSRARVPGRALPHRSAVRDVSEDRGLLINTPGQGVPGHNATAQQPLPAMGSAVWRTRTQTLPLWKGKTGRQQGPSRGGVTLWGADQAARTPAQARADCSRKPQPAPAPLAHLALPSRAAPYRAFSPPNCSPACWMERGHGGAAGLRAQQSL